jgi:hypothetical protein
MARACPGEGRGRAYEPHDQRGHCQAFHYDTHDQLRSHLADFVMAYNFAERLRTLKGLTHYEFICKPWTNEPRRSTLNPLQTMLGLHS